MRNDELKMMNGQCDDFWSDPEGVKQYQPHHGGQAQIIFGELKNDILPFVDKNVDWVYIINKMGRENWDRDTIFQEAIS